MIMLSWLIASRNIVKKKNDNDTSNAKNYVRESRRI